MIPILLIALAAVALLIPAIWRECNRTDATRDLIQAAGEAIRAYDALATAPGRKAADWRRASGSIRALEDRAAARHQWSIKEPEATDDLS